MILFSCLSLILSCVCSGCVVNRKHHPCMPMNDRPLPLCSDRGFSNGPSCAHSSTADRATLLNRDGTARNRQPAIRPQIARQPQKNGTLAWKRDAVRITAEKLETRTCPLRGDANLVCDLLSKHGRHGSFPPYPTLDVHRPTACPQARRVGEV